MKTGFHTRRSRGRAKAEVFAYDNDVASFHLYDPVRGLSFTQYCTHSQAMKALTKFSLGHDITPQEVRA